jgi:endonuclease/exonuclease/phosphatase (EEP) superfamily protein YafD
MKLSLPLLLGAFFAIACATVPLGVSNRTLRTGTPDEVSSACHPADPDHVTSSADVGRNRELDPANIRLLIWNTQKGHNESWLEEFAELSADQDVLVLQEALLKDGFRSYLDSQTLSWSLATTFVHFQVETGVLTASRIAPTSSCVQRTMEPLIALPKSTLVSRFPIEGSSETLLIGNVHAVNFTLGRKAFQSQFDRLATVLDQHEGPVIIAGDFNSWSDARSRYLSETFLEERSMNEVVFEGNVPRKIFGNEVDHVYYRGLSVIEGRVLETGNSDHAPILVQFSRSQEATL